MPIPAINDAFLAQVVFRPDIVPASNTFVNTFFFARREGVASTDTQMFDEIESLLEDFYENQHAAGLPSILNHMSTKIDATLTVVKIYDLEIPAPRTPETRGMSAVQTAASTNQVNELAAVLSYASGTITPAGGTIDKTRRGRLYIGPLNATALDTSTEATDVVLSTTIRSQLAAAGTFLAGNSHSFAQWMQYSRVLNRMSPVTGGFVNNNVDIQRRRGIEATARTVWAA